VAKRKSLVLNVPNEIMQDAKDYIQAEILRKLAAARQIVELDKEIAAGIYVYALEELGKLEVLKQSEQKDSQYSLKYEEEFSWHRVKFKLAVDYLQKVGHPECILLKGSFSKKSFGDLSNYSLLLGEVEACLGIFYTDFEYEKSTNTATRVRSIPLVNETKLKLAVDALEDVIIKWS
jgi:hypothetical protein